MMVRKNFRTLLALSAGVALLAAGQGHAAAPAAALEPWGRPLQSVADEEPVRTVPVATTKGEADSVAGVSAILPSRRRTGSVGA